MRAGSMLRALARGYRVTLLVSPRYSPWSGGVPGEILACCEHVIFPGNQETLSIRERFDVAHVFRLAALPDATPWLKKATARHIDLDDLESVSGRRMASVARANNRPEAAARAELAVEEARAREDAACAEFDRVYVASETDRLALLQRQVGKAEVIVLPNTLPLPEMTPFPPPTGGSFSLLFVGTLGYAPNEDAMQFFCASMLPRIQAGADRRVTLRIVGVGAGPAVVRLGGQAGVEVIGEVPDIAPWYRDAHLAIVPIRAGGGTRIKLLEAFAQRRPVVTTTIGAEGIAAEDGRHLLIADDPAAFATACLRLLHDPELAARIANDAFELFTRSYTDDVLAGLVAALPDVPQGGA